VRQRLEVYGRIPMVTSGRPPLRMRAATFGEREAFGTGAAVSLLNVYRLFWCTIHERNGAHVAQKIQTLFIDDIDGSAAEGTVRFALDGTEYEIDLNAKHAEALRKALAKYVDAARRSTGTVRRPARSGRRASASGVNTTEVREWAKAQGIEVKDRGRVPAELVVRFRAATGN
jgi:Lsr2